MIGKDADAAAAAHQCAGAADARRQGRHGEVTKRGGADQDRRHAQRRGGRCAPGQRSPRSPGINDNGIGVAAVLETAAAARRAAADHQRGAVRVLGRRGGRCWRGRRSTSRAWTATHLNDIALYLNFDMLGSPNAGFFTYDGDQSGQPNPDVPAASVPAGSAGIERTLAGYLNLAGVRPADMPLGHASDYSPFLTAGMPIGGITTGASQRKTEVQARLWGGTAGVAFDPNYHTPRDTVDNVNRDALAVTGPAVAFAVGTYAQSIEGVNGVPTPRAAPPADTPERPG